jgi:hypothetical protein
MGFEMLEEIISPRGAFLPEGFSPRNHVVNGLLFISFVRRCFVLNIFYTLFSRGLM